MFIIPPRKRSSSRGFTIVELLIVVVIIAILASITAAAFNGVQARALNDKIISSVNASVKLLNMYYSEQGAWPEEPAPGKSTLEYCLGSGYPTAGASGTSTYDSTSINSPRQWCSDLYGSGRAESNWLTNALAPYGRIPQATALQGSNIYAPVYGVSYPGYTLMWRGVPGIAYPVVNGTTQDGTGNYITYALSGNVTSCGVTGAQKVGTYLNTTSCLLMLEFFGA